MKIRSKAFLDQKAGTSGLRKKVKIFQTKHYTENFIQSIFNVVGTFDKAFVIGGDGRFYMEEALQIIIKMAVAQKVRHLLIGQKGLLSTPSVSHLIRKYNMTGGFILSASHNPGGEGGDFGIKYNMANGGPALEKLTDEFFHQSQKIDSYLIADMADIDLSRIGIIEIEDTKIEIIDSVKDYVELMEEIFDFPSIKAAREEGLTFQFDAMHGVTGIYAKEIFVNRLGFPKTSIWRGESLKDFGNTAPDPNLNHLSHLYELQMGDKACTLAAASDGDGDRNLIMGAKRYVSPSDSLAILLEGMDLIPYYQKNIYGVARSMPTSSAVDKVAQKKNIPCYETPTGWKFFASLLESKDIVLCGEESYGSGSCHIREKDGLWAILFWLNLLAISKKSVDQLLKDHWKNYGRYYYMRYDYEELDSNLAKLFIEAIRQNLDYYVNKSYKDFKIIKSDEFCYKDKTDGSMSPNQGIRFFLQGEKRVILRLSGTGTSGATLRIYMESFEDDIKEQDRQPKEKLRDLAMFMNNILKTDEYFNRNGPDVIT